MNEHVGTHIDAPFHTYSTGKYLHEIAMDSLMGPAVVIDLTEKAKTDPDYALLVDDIQAHEEKYGQIVEGSIIFVNTGGADVYGDINRYLGTQTPEDAMTMNFPAFGGPAREWLIRERKIRAIGCDRISFDVGKSLKRPVHYATSTKGIWGLENVNRIKEIPPRGATVIVMPMTIEYGSGAPVKIIAFLDNSDLDVLMSGSIGLNGTIYSMIFAVMIIIKYYL